MKNPPRMTKVLCNPGRARILESLEEDSATPAQLAERVGQGIGQVAYHVWILTEAGCVRAVGDDEEPAAVERVYEALPPVKWAQARSSAARSRRRGSGRRRPPRQG